MSKQDQTNSETVIPSPCINVCVLDLSDVCEGCFRTMDEISHWSDFDTGQRQEVIRLCWERAKDSGRTL